MKSLERIQITNNNLLNWLLQGKDNSWELPYYTKDMMLDHLDESYSYLDKKNQNGKTFVLDEFRLSDYEKHKIIVELTSIISKNKSMFCNFIIQGSFGDMQLVDGWSDFDAIAVISKNSINKSNRFNLLKICQKADNLMRKIDPYQHHGIHFIHEYEMNSYPNLYFPTSLFSETKCIIGSKDLIIDQVDSKKHELKRLKAIFETLKKASNQNVLKHHPKNNIFLEENYKNSYTMYQLKYFLCVIMLIPTLWLNCLGNYCSKSKSFKIISNYFKEEDLELIRVASLIRKMWCENDRGDATRNEIPEWVKEILGLNYLKRGGELAQRFENELNKRL